ncbi:MAG: hypothetical protein JNM89_13370 [Hyphomicrobiaceae bacterium]|nr:hypothetical protein [Hyphomicrobiaceae bacterium]
MARQNGGRALLSTLAPIIAAAWIVTVAYLAWRGWPHVSLDLSAQDAATQAAYRTAVMRHLTAYAVLAIAPAGLLVLAARFVANRIR